MPGPQGELMTRENLISTEWHQRSPTNGHVKKLFLESEFQHKGNKQATKNVNSQENIAFSSAATDSDHRIIQIIHKKGQNNIWTELSSLGQEPTFKPLNNKLWNSCTMISKARLTQTRYCIFS